METNKKIWKVWLRPNLLTKDVDNDYTAEVSTVGKTLRNEDLAQRIINEGSEIKYDTLLSIMNQRDRIIREALQEGTSVLTQVCQFTPRVTGPWIGSTAKFDPEKHKITVSMAPSSELRKDLLNVGVEVLVVKDTNARIGLVTDTVTNLADGSITPGDDILINGERIRVAGEAEGVGVFFVNAEGVATPVTRRLTQNDPKTVIARVPADLADGNYTLRIVTQYSNSAVMLKEPRSIEYGIPLIVGNNDRPVIE
ncbi:DNA-binding domain-containing protein [uncultured Parabacteroides sp.]|jgi:hypothetical protein|uniref:DNA-binding domain-containing protein n=1 Tax=uncultured Parabacteroides sp. TaxID=512312 RepID=UPI0025D4A17D|nr:DNA-binding domain-containing protein [uncultured Parabacteroides sp.]